MKKDDEKRMRKGDAKKVENVPINNLHFLYCIPFITIYYFVQAKSIYFTSYEPVIMQFLVAQEKIYTIYV